MAPGTKNWRPETGFTRNEELQWYQLSNAYIKKGMLIIEARKEHQRNPAYVVVVETGVRAVHSLNTRLLLSKQKACKAGNTGVSKCGAVFLNNKGYGLPGGHWEKPGNGLPMERSI